ncbi:MAG: pyridoxal phosphate-dependent decarboxylase family protein [bacterium]
MPNKNEFCLESEQIKQLGYQIVDKIAEEFTHPTQRPVFPPQKSTTEMDEYFGGELPQQGTAPEQLLDIVLQVLLPAAANPNHPRLMANVLAGSLALPALIQALSAAIKLRPTSWKEQPASCHIEVTVTRWLGQMVGFDQNAAGYVTLGGSWANLMGIAMARVCKSGWDVRQQGLVGQPPLVIYVSQEAHSSIEKSVQLLGIGSHFLRQIPVDKQYRIRLNVLEKTILDDQQAGLKPFCVIGYAGTVNTGAIDPLDQLAQIAQQYGLWFHIDGAYGAFAALDPTVKPLLKGIEQADSLTLDPHKWLNIPFEAGCILTKHWDTLEKTFNIIPPYIQGMMGTGHNQSEYGFELSRTDRALKVWLALKQYGVEQYAAMIIKHNALARYMAALLCDQEEFELMIETPVLSVCCFRYIPPDIDKHSPENQAILSQINLAIEQAILEDGRAMISGTNLAEQRVLRICIVSTAVTQASIDEVLSLIKDYGRSLSQKVMNEMLHNNHAPFSSIAQ